MISFRMLSGAAIAAALLATAGSASAGSWPERSIQAISPFAAGNANDIVARIVLDQVGRQIGQSFVIENRPGGGGSIGTAAAAKADPDGYTLLLYSSSLSSQVVLHKSLPFDPVKDFAPIVRLITTSMVLLVRSDFPASTLKDFIAHAKAKPNGLTAGYGSAATIVSIAKLRTAAGFKTLDVPYKGVPLAITDVLGGQVDFTLGDLAVSMPQIHGGKMKGLGVTSPQRSPLAPELPAIAEMFPGFETRIWYGLVAPANTPKAVVAKVHDVVTASLAKPDVKARLAGLGLEPAPMPPDEFGAFIRQEIAKWTKEIREAGIQPE